MVRMCPEKSDTGPYIGGAAFQLVAIKTFPYNMLQSFHHHSKLLKSAMISSIVSTLHARIDVFKTNTSLRDAIIHNWYLGWTSFGGPAVHFQIVRAQTFLELDPY